MFSLLRKYVSLIDLICFTKLIPQFKSLPYVERLQKMKLPSMYYRRARGDMIEVYKYMHEIYKTENPLIRDVDNRTRGHIYKLKKPKVKTSKRLNFFSVRVVDLWNDLPEEVVTAKSMNCFKNKLDQYWYHIKYIQDFVTISKVKRTI